MSTENSTPVTFKKDIVTKKKMASYSMGPFIDSFLQSGYNMIVFYYYEVEIGLATALVGFSFVIYAVWNMINDPLTGFLTDRPMRWSRKYGMRTPWIIFGGIMLTVTFYFLFSVPDIDAKTNPWPIFWYMVIVTCLYDTFYSIFTCHYIGGFANIFRTKEQRRKGSMISMVIGLMGRMICVAILIPAVIVYGDISSFIRFAFISCIILIAALILFLPGIYENEYVKNRYLQIYELLEVKKLPYFKFLKIMFKQKNFMLALICLTLWNISYTLQQVSAFFFLRDVLKFDLQVLAIAQVFWIISFFPGMFIWSRFVAKKIAHINLFIIGFLIYSCVLFSLMWITTLTEYYIIWFIGGISISAFYSVIMSIISDCNDEVVNACGRHVEAGLIGARNFFLRATFLVVGIIISATHILTGYVPSASSQTELAQLGIRMHTGLFGGIFSLIGAILLIKFYDLKGDKREQLMVSLRKQGL